MKRISLVVVAIGLLLFTTGCPSFSTLRTAEPIEEGETNVGISAGYLGLAAVGTIEGPEGEEETAALGGELPTFEIYGRHGIAPDADIGIKVYPIGAAFEANYAFVNDESFALSINPYLGFTRVGGDGESFTYGFALANILADVLKVDILTVTLGLKPGVFYGFGGGIFDATPMVGAMGGIDLQLTDDFSVMPSFDIMLPVTDFGSGYFYTGSLAFNF